MILVVRFLPLIVLAIRIYQVIKMHIDHKRSMRILEEYNDFHKQILEWSEQIKDKNVRDQFLIHGWELVNSKVTKFDKEKELEIIREKFGKWIPELVQQHRQEQIDKLI